MFTYVLRKIINNKRMIGCLVLGLVILVTLACSIPIFSNVVFEKALINDLMENERTDFMNPGVFKVDYDIKNAFQENIRYDIYKNISNNTDNYTKNFGIPLQMSSKEIEAGPIDIKGFDNNFTINTRLYLKSLSGLEGKLEFLQGEMSTSKVVNGVYEGMISDYVFKQYPNVKIGDTLAIFNGSKSLGKIKITGIFKIKDEADKQWIYAIKDDLFNTAIIIDNDILQKNFIDTKDITPTKLVYRNLYDYTQINLKNVKSIVVSFNQFQDWSKDVIKNNVQSEFIGYNILYDYFLKQEKMQVMLWIIQIPVFIMLLFYIFMVSNLIVNRERNENAIIFSRGGSRMQVMYSYFIQGILLSGVALIVSPILSLILCRVIAKSDGFLQFSGESVKNVSLNATAILYSIIAIIVFLVTLLVPVYLGTDRSIVSLKQNYSKKKISWWKIIGLDVILLGIGLYGLYMFNNRQVDLQKVTTDASDKLNIDPLMFLSSTAFILGAALIFIRIYPFIIKFIYFIGHKKWSAVFYSSFIQISRTKGAEQFLMLFLILTVAVSIFSASAARTLNGNAEDKANYAVGADLKMRYYWGDEKKAFIMSSLRMPIDQIPTEFKEPPFTQYTDLKGVDDATKVYVRKEGNAKITLRRGDTLDYPTIMLVEPDKFKKIAWSKEQLFGEDYYRLLDLMQNDKNAVILSNSFKTRYNASINEGVIIDVDGYEIVNGYVAGFVEYWPSINPKEEPDYAIGNLVNVGDTNIGVYEAWIKKTSKWSKDAFLNDISEKQYDKDPSGIIQFSNATEAVDVEKSASLLKGINGSMTLTFILTMLLSIIGYLIYWILSVKGRELQFGIIRAMGLSKGKIYKMLILEQLLISGIAMGAGVLIGNIASTLYVPLFKLANNAADQVPEFIIIKDNSDYIKLYVIFGLMLLTGLITLGTYVRSLKIHEAIKIGEE